MDLDGDMDLDNYDWRIGKGAREMRIVKNQALMTLMELMIANAAKIPIYKITSDGWVGGLPGKLDEGVDLTRLNDRSSVLVHFDEGWYPGGRREVVPICKLATEKPNVA